MEQEVQKGIKDFAKLAKKKVMGKDGIMHTVWVKLGEDLHNWKQKQHAKYAEHKPKKQEEEKEVEAVSANDSKEEKKDMTKTDKAVSLLKAKTKGVVKGLKHEVQEWREAGAGIMKLMHGKAPSKEEAAALKTVAVHLAIVSGIAAATGAGAALGGADGAVGAALVGAKVIGGGFLEHVLSMRIGHALLFAKGEFDDDKYSDEELEAALEHLVHTFADYIEKNHKDKK